MSDPSDGIVEVPGLPDGYAARRPTAGDRDVEALLAIARADDEAVIGESDFIAADVRAALTQPHVDRACDHWLVEDAGGRPVCWGFLWDSYGSAQVDLDAYLVRSHPEDVRLAVLDTLLARVAERAVERGHAEVTLGAGCVVGDEAYARSLRSRGFSAQRRFSRMRVTLAPGRPYPSAPPGVQVRAFDPGAEQDWVDFHRIYVESFGEHWGSERMSLQAYRGRVEHEENPGFERWTFADVDGRPGGICQASGQFYGEGGGWVRNLGVLAEHRGRGVGRFLLEHALAGFAADGRSWAGLGVDTENVTGALRLYESVGMRPWFQADAYRRVVRAGAPGGRQMTTSTG